MVFISLFKPSAEQQRRVADEGQRHGFNYPHVGGTRDAPALPEVVAKEGWVVDRKRVKVGSGRRDYDAARDFVRRWGHFQLGWASVEPDTPVKFATCCALLYPHAAQAGTPVCVSARSLALWTSNPLEVVYCREGDERRPLQPPPAAPATSSSSPSPSSSSLAAATQPAPRQQQQQKQQLGPPRRVFTFAHGCTRGHLLKGEERFAVEWEASGDGSVWYEVTTFSKPDHPLAVLTYPLVRMYQAKFGRDSADAVARGVAEARK